MRVVGSILVLVLALAGGYFVLQGSVKSAPDAAPLTEQIDVVSIRNKLLAVGQAERQYFVAHNSYATLEQLTAEDLVPGGTELRGYTMSASASGSERFTITAMPTGGKAGWPTLEIDQSMQVTER